MLSDVHGMKVLLLDKDTTKIVSTVYSQSEILRQEVFLVESLVKEAGDQLFHLKVCHPRRRLTHAVLPSLARLRTDHFVYSRAHKPTRDNAVSRDP
jgi:hypothetical protein